MNRVSLVLVASLVACGGGGKKQTNLAPLPADDKPAEAKVEPKKEEPTPEPPKPLPPLEVKVEVPAVTVKLVSAGKGKKAPLKYTAKAGAKQQVEVVMSFAQTASVDGQSEAQVVPTIVLAGEAETKSVDATGKADYALAVASTDARDVEGAAVPVDQFKLALASLAGLVISGSVDANGTTAETRMRIEKPDRLSAGALDLIKITFPSWPVLPKEPIGVGAKWQTTSNNTLRAAPGDKGIEMTHVTSYELVSKAGSTYTIKSKTTVTGKDQEYKGGKISKINGTGTSEIKLDEGALYPTSTGTIETNLTASEGTKAMQLAFKIGGSINAKAGTQPEPVKIEPKKVKDIVQPVKAEKAAPAPKP